MASRERERVVPLIFVIVHGPADGVAEDLIDDALAKRVEHLAGAVEGIGVEVRPRREPRLPGGWRRDGGRDVAADEGERRRR